MKKLLFIFILCITQLGCLKDVLERKPLNRVSDADVWNSAKLIDLYLVALYDNIPFGFNRNGYFYESNLTDEASQPYAGGTIVGGYGNNNLTLNINMYSWIRKANYFLQMIPTSSVTDTEKKEYTAECRFIRAYYYFDLVKKYGGMPIINEVQNFDGEVEPLLVSRNKEDEVYEFILAELNAAIADLPAMRSAANSNRATKWTAQALKARSMLYAGTIAKFGTVQLNGLLGVPADKSVKYLTESYNAAKAIIDGKAFSLYTKLYDPVSKSGNPVENFQQIFLDKNNVEVIFQKAYSNPDKLHAWDTYNLPESFKPGCCGNAQAPTLEMAESFEFVDGTPGVFDVNGREFNSPDDLYKNKDPRFDATIFRSESPFVGRNVQIYRGIYDVDNKLYDAVKTPFPADPTMLQVGRDGPFTLGDIGKTGFHLKKYITFTEIVPEGRSSTNYIDFRYAEILLTFAEAAFEGNLDPSGALDAINQVRRRAGVREITAGELTRDRIRNERKVELAFEDKRFWDIRRYRIGTSLFSNTFVHGLWPYLKYTGSSYKYTFKKVQGAPIDNGFPRVWEERDNYSNLAGYIATNKNIVNNPGW